MSKSKHTSGPWSNPTGSVTVREAATPRSLKVCDMSSDGGRPVAEQEANARLIAAAPDLLAALEESLREVEAFTKRTGIPQFVGWIDKARAAIAKAKGETP